jgi:hypothetical protein
MDEQGRGRRRCACCSGEAGEWKEVKEEPTMGALMERSHGRTWKGEERGSSI